MRPFQDSRQEIVQILLVSVRQLVLQGPWRIFWSSTILIVNEVV
jgi:hypothetical protein